MDEMKAMFGGGHWRGYNDNDVFISARVTSGVFGGGHRQWR